MWDVDDSVAMHIALTEWLPADHPDYEKRFSRATPQLSRSAYMRILDPVSGVAPTSTRIMQDIRRCFTDHILALLLQRVRWCLTWEVAPEMDTEMCQAPRSVVVHA